MPLQGQEMGGNVGRTEWGGLRSLAFASVHRGMAKGHLIIGKGLGDRIYAEAGSIRM